MTRINALILSVVPGLLICLAVAVTVMVERMTSADQIESRQEMLSTLITAIQSGDIEPSKEQVVAYLKATEDLEKTHKRDDELIGEVLRGLAQVLALLGLAQLGLVVLYSRKARGDDLPQHG